MTRKTPSRNVNPGPRYQKAGASRDPISWDPEELLLDRLNRIVDSDFDIPRMDVVSQLLALSRYITVLRRKANHLYRAFIPAHELYNIFIEVGEELLFLIREEHRRSSKQNLDVKFVPGEMDELSNPKILKIYPRDLIVASDETEVLSLQFILENLISLKRNRRPLRELLAIPRFKNLVKQQEEDKQGRKHLYTRRQQREAKNFYALQVDQSFQRKRKVETGKFYSPDPEYFYTEFKEE